MTGVLCLTLAAGCAGVTQPPPVAVAVAQTTPRILEPNLAEPIPAEAPQDGAVAAALAGAESKEEARAAPAPAEPRQAAKAVVPSPKAPAKAIVPLTAVEPPRKTEAPAPAPAAATLDLAGLTARLRDTNAIGAFTKLALKNQVDDLLKQFRVHYQGGQKTSVASLRPPYDMLVLKVLALVQDGDPTLARSISGSREAIWGILADREKFNSVT